MSPLVRMIRSSALGLLALLVIVFVPAGTLRYWQGWTFVVIFSLCSNLVGLYLAFTNAELLERRMSVGPAAETRPAQKAVVTLAFAAVIGLVIVSALDHRLRWSTVPTWASVLGDVLIAAGLLVNLWILRENSYAAATIMTVQGQGVASSGPYALVRHPLYAAALVLIAGAPLALGSYWGLAFLLPIVPLLALRILDEEKMLREELDGYAAYMEKVRYRLVPGLW